MKSGEFTSTEELVEGKIPTCLSIAGLDPSGGAGIIADLKTFSAFRCYGSAAITSVTFQNTQAVYGAEPLSPHSVRGQIEPILDDFNIDAFKTGMLPNKEVIDVIADIISERRLGNAVIDPVVRATSGFDLIDDAALVALIDRLFPLATIVTPNIPEAERITGLKISGQDSMIQAAEKIKGFVSGAVLIKGGHFPSERNGVKVACDLFLTDSDQIFIEAEFIESRATHGTGCTLAAAITSCLAQGMSVEDSVRKAKRYVSEAIRSSPMIGKGHPAVNHLLDPFED
jgi:hydroxymethylpyrimidine/phosphomethylpyrimidine kinase